MTVTQLPRLPHVFLFSNSKSIFTSMTITIQRTFMKGEITEGHVSIDGQRICDTLENSFSCLAPGSYAVELVKCKQYARKMILVKTFVPRCLDCPRLKFVFGNTRMPQPCPQLKPGNGIHTRHDGAILVRPPSSLGCIIHRRDGCTALYDRIRKNVERGREVTLEIKETLIEKTWKL